MQTSIAGNEPSLIVEVPARRPHLSHLSFYSGSTPLAIYGLSRSEAESSAPDISEG